MPWCPKCRSEYPDDCVRCCICGKELVLADPSHGRSSLADSVGRLVLVLGTAAVAAWVFVLSAMAVAFGASFVALPGVAFCVAACFYAGHRYSRVLNTASIWLGWLLLGAAVLLLDKTFRGDLYAIALSVCCCIGAMVMWCGMKHRRTNHWAYLIVPIPLLGVAFVVLVLAAPG